MKARGALILALGLLAAPACISPSVVESSGRAVAPATVELAWRPTRDEDLRGLFESVSIEGEAAASLWKLFYYFGADGSYSGAALVIGSAEPEFQTLSGRWALEGELLDLGDGEAVRVTTSGDHVKLETSAGIATLRRAAVQ